MISKPESCSFQLCGGLNPFWEPQIYRETKVRKRPFLLQNKNQLGFPWTMKRSCWALLKPPLHTTKSFVPPSLRKGVSGTSHSKMIGTWKIGIQTCWCSGFLRAFHCILHQGLRNVGKRKPRKECISRTESDHGVDRIYELAHFLAKRKCNPPKK